MISLISNCIATTAAMPPPRTKVSAVLAKRSFVDRLGASARVQNHKSGPQRERQHALQRIRGYELRASPAVFFEHDAALEAMPDEKESHKTAKCEIPHTCGMRASPRDRCRSALQALAPPSVAKKFRRAM